MQEQGRHAAAKGEATLARLEDQVASQSLVIHDLSLQVMMMCFIGSFRNTLTPRTLSGCALLSLAIVTSLIIRGVLKA